MIREHCFVSLDVKDLQDNESGLDVLMNVVVDVDDLRMADE